MLDELVITNFTVFKQARFEFGRGLNVLIGDNGTGKTQVLKLGYLFCKAWPALTQNKLRVDKQRAESYIEERLAGLFRIGDLSHLISRDHKAGATITANVVGRIPNLQVGTINDPLAAAGVEKAMPWAIRLKREKDQHGGVDVTTFPGDAATIGVVPRAVFVPSKEIVSLFKGLVGLFDAYREFPLDETYRDLATSLAVLEPVHASTLLPELEAAIARAVGGELRLLNGELVLAREDGSTLESTLMAEGHRKLALLIYLVRHRVIEAGGALFWDEPEANLNPAAVRLVAAALYALAQGGAQVVLATHSLFLLREFEVLAAQQPMALPPRYFALGFNGKKGVTVSANNDLAAIDPLVLLDEDLAQSDRFIGASK
jgi:energy-coupling factor transporter ATP-binding protein EcfA2